MTDRPNPVGPQPGDNRALLSVATQFFENGLVVASFVPRLPAIRDRADISTATLGALLAIGSAAGLLGSLAVGRLIERFGTRRVLISGALTLVASLAAVGLATHAAHLVARTDGPVVNGRPCRFGDEQPRAPGSAVAGPFR